MFVLKIFGDPDTVCGVR